MSSPSPVCTGLSGLWIPLVTPFHRDARVDHSALAALVQRLNGSGIAGYVACGSTGEAPALDEDEQDAVLATVLRAAQGLPVMMGLSGYQLGHVLDRVRHWNGQPLAGLLVPSPHYIRPSQAGLIAWFTAIADASVHPLVVYDIPYRTGVMLELGTLRELARHPRIRAIKDCGGDAAKTQALIADGRLDILAGEDAQILTTLALGGRGAIAASAHWQTARFVELVRCVQSGELPRARALWQALAPMVDLFFAEPNPAPLKAWLAQQGAVANVLRAPMQPANTALVERAAALAQQQEAVLDRL